jgi:DeoR/GlpR family transcriptional regulator of sugar metabolism/transposase
MASPKLEPLVLSQRERQVLQGWAERGTAQRLVLRSRIVLACAGGAPVSAVASDLGVSRVTAAKWRSRFLAARLEGLGDEPRPGRPRTITDQHVERVVAATLQQEPPGGQARWSTRSMARRERMSQTAVARIWRAFGLKPHLPPAGQGTVGHLARRTQINNSESPRDAAPADEAGPGRNGGRARPGTVLAAERKDLLLARLRRDGKLVARDLAAELGLSEDSVRRDLRDLAAAGLCQRVYGGALPVSPALGTEASRSAIAPDSKRRVGARAAGLITPGSSVILGGGTTAQEVVAALPADLEATIITHSGTVATALASHPRVNVLMLGGQLHKQSVATTGAIAAEAASGITADLALLTLPGVHPHEGLTAIDPELAAMMRILISRAADTYVMASIEKLGTVAAYKVAGLAEVTGVITDAPADHLALRQLRDQGTTIIRAAG